jgi:predicted nicotinamide N-methyase
MPGYLVKHQDIAIAGVADLHMRSLLDRQQFSDPLDAAADQGISSAAWPMFGLLWPSGLELAMRMATRPVRADERILEIGCGLALASLVSHRRGADITASDCHPLSASFLTENLRLNQLAPMRYRHGHWSASTAHPQPLELVEGRFDLIIGSDLLYEPDDSASLAGFIARHAAPGALIWIIDPDRGNRPAFNRAMKSFGFTLHEERISSAATPTHAAYKGRLLAHRAP